MPRYSGENVLQLEGDVTLQPEASKMYAQNTEAACKHKDRMIQAGLC
jgi:hypothetical protein